MTALLTRLTTATAGSRELDAEVAMALGWQKVGTLWWSPYRADGSSSGRVGSPPFTTSLDPAFAEVERRGLSIDVWVSLSGMASCCIWRTEDETAPDYTAATPALAACAALIAAVEAGS